MRSTATSSRATTVTLMPDMKMNRSREAAAVQQLPCRFVVRVLRHEAGQPAYPAWIRTLGSHGRCRADRVHRVAPRALILIPLPPLARTEPGSRRSVTAPIAGVSFDHLLPSPSP